MLPLCSGFAKRAPATFPLLGFLYTARGLIMGLHRPVPVCIPLCNTQVPLDLPNKLVRPDYRYLLPSVTEAVAVTQVYFSNFVVGGI